MSQIVRHNESSRPGGITPHTSEPITWNQASNLDIQAVFRRLSKRKLLIATVALLAVVPAVVATLLATPFYSSSALIQVNPDPVQVFPYHDIADSGGGVYYEVYMSTQDQILRSPNLFARVGARLQAEHGDATLSHELPFLGQRFHVWRVPNSQLFRINYRAPSADTAARMVNIFAEEYLKQHLEARQETREKARESLQRELEGLEKRLQISEKGLVSYARREDIVSVGSEEGDLVQKRLSTLDQQVAAAESEVIVAQNRLDMRQKASARTLGEALTTPVITNLTSTLHQAEVELTHLRASFGENWPAVVTKRNEIELIQQQLSQEKARIVSQSVEQAQLDLSAAQSRLRSASNALAEQKGAVNRYNNALIEYNILRREAETNRKLHDALLERLRQTSLQRGTEFGNLQVVDPGRPNYGPESPRVWYNVALASLLGLTLGVGAAFLRDFWDNSVSSLEGVEEFTHLPGLGSVPSSKFFALRSTGSSVQQPWISDSSVQVLNLSSPVLATRAALPPPEVAEAIRAVCASILLSQSDQPLRVIAVTSAVPGEGKTTVVGEVGRALAEGGARTLLVEADLRKPLLAETFDIQQGDGLSLYLSGHSSSPRICETDQPNLFVAPAGPTPPNPVALLGSERMTSFLEQVASSFRFILIDTPPILAVADAQVLGAKADGIILVIRARGTAKSLIVRARAVLQKSGINLLGAILNRVDPENLHSKYYQAYYTAR